MCILTAYDAFVGRDLLCCWDGVQLGEAPEATLSLIAPLDGWAIDEKVSMYST